MLRHAFALEVKEGRTADFRGNLGKIWPELTAFLDALASHPYVISYNGNSFDLKFIETRCRQYQLTMPDYQSIDLMVSAKWMKKRGFLSDCKLVTVEKALGIHREDRYSGGELISVYRNYRLKKKISVCRTDSRFPMFDGTKKYSDYNISDYFCNFSILSFFLR